MCTGLGPTATRDTTWEGQYTCSETPTKTIAKAAHWSLKPGASRQLRSHFKVWRSTPPAALAMVFVLLIDPTDRRPTKSSARCASLTQLK